MKTGVIKQADSALLERMIEVNPQGMLALDKSLRYVLWNPAMERISGLGAAAVIGRAASDMFPFLAETGEDRALRAALNGAHVTSKNRPFHIAATQRVGHYDAEYWPWVSSTGEIIGVVGVVEDVTDIRRAEQQLSETENRFKNMADVAPVLLWMSRTDSFCTFFNQTWLDFTGRTLEQEWGIGWAEGIHFEDFQTCMDTYSEAFSRREVFEMEYRLKRKDGEYRWILDRGTPRYTPDGTFAGYIGSCVDITDLKQLEQELRKAVHVREEFLSVASHELRTPLTALQLQIESLLRTLEKQPEDATRTRIIRNATLALEKTHHLDAMVGVLLDVARLSRGQMQLDCQEFALNELLGAIVERLTESAASVGCELRLHLDAEHRGVWDRVRLQQVITNLIANALKFGARKPIEIAVRKLSNGIEIAVTDQGPGIAPEHQAQLFQQFTRFASTKNYGGLGLGLWISKEIVRAHGGTIRVQSQLGHGASFVVELPNRTHPAARQSAEPQNEVSL